FDYGQRLPSLEGSSSAPISKGTPNMAPHSVFAWQPFGNTSVHNQPQASSFHGQPAHLIPLIPGSTATYSGMVSSSPASSMPTTTDLMDCHQKTNSHYAYSTNYSSSSASNKSRSIVLSPATQSGCCPSDVQNIRLGMLLPNSHSPTTAPVPIYAPSLSSTTTSSSAPHQAFCSPNSSSSSNLFSTPPVLSNHPVQDPAKAVSQKQRSKKESHNRSQFTIFDYGQRLPSLEGSSSAPISKGTPNMAPHSVFAWQPFGNTSVHNQPQASSFHGQPAHLIPLIPGSTATYSGMVSSSPASSMPTTTDLMDCHQKTNSHYAYSTNYSSSSASNKSRSIVLSPATQSGCCPSDVQNIRLGMLLPNSHSPTTAPVPIYAPSLSSTTTSSSAPHQAFCSPNSSSSSNLFSTPPVLSNHPVQDPAKAVSQKQRSKKESHNRSQFTIVLKLLIFSFFFPF
ncbi:microphthalmia-associated transcription factor, partial [Schistosoma bovis]